MKYTLLLITFLTITSCSPRLNYLGDTYPPTAEVDIYYDEGDIKNDFKVIGQLSGDNSNNPTFSVAEIKDKMVEEAKNRGAHGIWFLFSDSLGDSHIVKSKLLMYTD